MSIEDVDVAIIGAGPSGLIAAREASVRGVKVVVLEEHGEIGLPCHCAGLLSIRGLDQIGAPSSGASYIQNRFRGAHFFSPSNLSFTVERRNYVACVVDRHLLDNFLASQALESGSEIRLNSRVQSVRCDGKGWILNIGGYDRLRAKIIIDAEGASPRILGMTGLRPLKTTRLLRGLSADIKGVSLDPDYVEVHFSTRIAPGLFAWVIPLEDGEAARVGLACRGSNPYRRLIKFVKKRFERDIGGGGLRPLTYRSGLVITCGPIKKTYGDGLLVVGDSAGQVKPITGGGVVFGGICASIAGKVASEAAKNNRTGGSFLKTYEDMWRARLGKEIRIALLARKIINRLSDRDLDKVFSTIIRSEIYKDLSADGDMDHQGTTILKIVRRRGIFRFLPFILKALLSAGIGG
ncbi:MAG: NAD(P)/FAD-dependent oxidoreductase [Candidatus Bathyarchaeia archaeon]|nr:NAD(P)/FAD-dependent oxidoreductase [Candidatus Bathyarchaeota archaeon]